MRRRNYLCIQVVRVWADQAWAHGSLMGWEQRIKTFRGLLCLHQAGKIPIPAKVFGGVAFCPVCTRVCNAEVWEILFYLLKTRTEWIGICAKLQLMPLMK